MSFNFETVFPYRETFFHPRHVCRPKAPDHVNTLQESFTNSMTALSVSVIMRFILSRNDQGKRTHSLGAMDYRVVNKRKLK